MPVRYHLYGRQYQLLTPVLHIPGKTTEVSYANQAKWVRSHS